MKKQKYKVSYYARHAPDGTYYRQSIRITQKTFNRLLSILEAEILLPSSDDYYYNLYLKQPLRKNNNLVFLNLTQRDFFNKWLKCKILDYNTYLIIS